MANCFQCPEPGDHISVGCLPPKGRKYCGKVGVYRHHLLVTSAKGVGDDTFDIFVVHLIRCNGGRVAEPSVPLRLKAGKFRKHSYNCRYSAREAIERARTQIDGKKVYQLFNYNCEHFVRWAKTGTTHSLQLRRLVLSVIAAGVGGVVVGAAGAAVGGGLGALVPIPVIGVVVGAFIGGAAGIVIGITVGGSAEFTRCYTKDRIDEL